MAHKKAGGSSRNGRDSESKRLGIKRFGGENVLTPPTESLPRCLMIMKETTSMEPDKYFMVNQFQNPLNPEVYYLQTGPEF